MSAVSLWCMTGLHIAPCFVSFACLQKAEIWTQWGGEREQGSAVPRTTDKKHSGISRSTKKANELKKKKKKRFGKPSKSCTDNTNQHIPLLVNAGTLELAALLDFFLTLYSRGPFLLSAIEQMWGWRGFGCLAFGEMLSLFQKAP